jgi:hypothetical protein
MYTELAPLHNFGAAELSDEYRFALEEAKDDRRGFP